MTGSVKKLCVIGENVMHSLSPIMHKAGLKASGLGKEFNYEPVVVKKGGLPGFINKLKSGEYHGASVTYPHKEDSLKHLSQLTEEAERIGAVNTLYLSDGAVIGHNTDGIGFLASLREASVDYSGKRIGVIGAGGASRAICFSLSEKAENIQVFNRTLVKARSLADDVASASKCKMSAHTFDDRRKLRDADIVINATPLGMKGHHALIGSSQSPLGSGIIEFSRGQVVCDIAYNPRMTGLLITAEKAGARIVDGSGMLVHQGAEQFRIFTGRQAPAEAMRKALCEALEKDEGCNQDDNL